MVMGMGPKGPVASSPAAWFNSLPQVTRVWFTISTSFSLGMALQLVDPLFLYHDPAITFGQFQIWRLFTNFFFLGKFGFLWMMLTMMVIQYSKALEKDYNGKTVNYLWLVLMGMSLLHTANWVFGLGYPFLAIPLIFYVMFIWCRRHPKVEMSIFGLFKIEAAWLPWFNMMMSALMGGSPIDMFLGIACGHVVFFLNDLHPWTAGSRIFSPPQFLVNLVPNDSAVDEDTAGRGFQGGGMGVPPASRPAAAAAGGGTMFRSSGYNWGSGRRLGD